MPPEGAPEAPSGAPGAEGPLPSTAHAGGEASAPAGPAPPSPPPLPPLEFKPTTFLLTFLFGLGIVMLISSSTREGVAGLFGLALTPLIGFGYRYVLLTMFLAGLIEMALTALAYNWATDWVKTARMGSMSSAFRKVQMEAMKSGKKDRIEALKPHQQEVLKLSTEVNMSQLKGMAVTWFLVLAIYTWVGLFLSSAALAVPGSTSVSLGGGAPVNIQHTFPLGPFAIPYWILLFSLYTFPLSYVLRRTLKHYSLMRYEIEHLGPTTDSAA